jgi:hypothetical protein
MEPLQGCVTVALARRPVAVFIRRTNSLVWFGY